ncbi:hypothetical protein [Terribacillus saccharophilus]|uniref:hypothetical protein n=1 Tax=Terribacillus saccharophilus TaxID=361277 RepID=UPI0039820AE1
MVTDIEEMRERLRIHREAERKRRIAAGLPEEAPDYHIVPATLGEYAFVKLDDIVPIVAKYITMLHKFNRPIPMDMDVFEDCELPLTLLHYCKEGRHGRHMGIRIAMGVMEKCNAALEDGEYYDIDDLKTMAFYAGRFLKSDNRHTFDPWRKQYTHEERLAHKAEVERLLNDEEYLNEKMREVGEKYREIEPLLEESNKNAKLKGL